MADKQPTMHCPACGAEAPLTQKFCRACGCSLEKITQVFAEQLASPELMLQTKKLKERQRKIQQAMTIAGIGAAAIVVASFYSGILYLLAVGSMPMIPGVVLLLLLTTAVIAGALATYSERLKGQVSASEKPELSLNESRESGTAQPASFVSVTERTTNLLGPEVNSSPQQRSE